MSQVGVTAVHLNCRSSGIVPIAGHYQNLSAYHQVTQLLLSQQVVRVWMLVAWAQVLNVRVQLLVSHLCASKSVGGHSNSIVMLH